MSLSSMSMQTAGALNDQYARSEKESEKTLKAMYTIKEVIKTNSERIYDLRGEFSNIQSTRSIHETEVKIEITPQTARNPKKLCSLAQKFLSGDSGYSQNTDQAIVLYQRGAKLNYAEADFALGEIYAKNPDKINSQLAVEHYKKAALGGHIKAIMALYYSEDVLDDDNEIWLTRAYFMDSTEAQNEFTEKYNTAEKVAELAERLIKKASKTFEKSAKYYQRVKQHPQACEMLQKLYREEYVSAPEGKTPKEAADEVASQFKEKNTIEFNKHEKKSKYKGDYCFKKANLIFKDAIACYQEAVEDGHGKSGLELGNHYNKVWVLPPKGQTKNEAALKAYLVALSQGYLPSTDCIAQYIPSNQRLRDNYLSAISSGHQTLWPENNSASEMCLKYGDEFAKRHPNVALVSYERADNSEGYRRMGLIYAKDDRVRDIQKAFEYYNKASTSHPNVETFEKEVVDLTNDLDLLLSFAEKCSSPPIKKACLDKVAILMGQLPFWHQIRRGYHNAIIATMILSLLLFMRIQDSYNE